jgi:hypothetical protein
VGAAQLLGGFVSQAVKDLGRSHQVGEEECHDTARLAHPLTSLHHQR